MLAHQPRHRIEIGDADSGVDRCLDEDGTGILAERRPPVPDLRGIDIGNLDAEPSQFLVEQGAGAAIDPGAGEEVVAGAQHRQMRQRRGAHPAGQKHRVLGALQESVLARDIQLIGVVAVAGVADFLVGTDRVGEGAALVDGWSDRAPIWRPSGQPVNRDGRSAAGAVGAHQSGNGR